jgi:integrase
MPLTDTTIRAAKSADKQQKFYDGAGLYLLVAPSGSKGWRFKYRFQGKEKLISLGQYPAVSLKDARERAAEARKTLERGKNPSTERKLTRLREQNTFELVAREWHGKQAPAWSESHAAFVLRNLERNVFPFIGVMPVAEILASDLLALLRRMENRDAVTVAKSVRSICSGIFRYAVATGRAERDPAADVRGAIAAHPMKNRAAITDPDGVGELLLAVDKYSGFIMVRHILRFLALAFCRPGEARHAEWAEFDFADRLWRIPAVKMKMSRDHLVPLSPQALAVLEAVRPFSGGGKYVFPSQGAERPLNAGTLVAALRRMEYSKEEMCAHGFRAMASTLLNEQGFSPDVIERQLAHVPGNQVRAAYNRAEYLPERRAMMDAWGNHLDLLRENAKRGTKG